MKLKNWIRDVRGDRSPQEKYVDAADAPSEPEGPYRARMAEATHHPVPEGFDVREREVVVGTLELRYCTRCPCGHEWESAQFQRMTLCAKCGRAVLVEEPGPPAK